MQGDLEFRPDGGEVYRSEQEADQFPEPLFAIRYFAKMKPDPMTQNWTMQVDWVKHESRQ